MVKGLLWISAIFLSINVSATPPCVAMIGSEDNDNYNKVTRHTESCEWNRTEIKDNFTPSKYDEMRRLTYISCRVCSALLNLDAHDFGGTRMTKEDVMLNHGFRSHEHKAVSGEIDRAWNSDQIWKNFSNPVQQYGELLLDINCLCCGLKLDKPSKGDRYDMTMIFSGMKVHAKECYAAPKIVSTGCTCTLM